MNLAAVVNSVAIRFFIGKYKKDEDTNICMELFDVQGRPIVDRAWHGNGPQPTGVWFGSGATWYPGATPPWTSTFEAWRAQHGKNLTLGDLVGAWLRITIANTANDNFIFSMAIECDVQGIGTIVVNSDRSEHPIGSDAAKYPTFQNVKLDLIQ